MPTTSKEYFRDAYGFEVKKEYQELHTKYTPLWDKEEVERRQRWSDFLHSFVGSEEEDSKNSSEEGEAALEAALKKLQESGAEKEDFPWWQQLRILVQAGLPMSLRGRLWKTFLQAHVGKQPGVYDALVCQALAPQYQNSRKLTDPMPRIDSFDRGPVDRAGIQEEQPAGSAPIQSAADRARSLAGQAPMYQGGAQDWTVQIEKDLHRTFPGHPVMDRSGRRSLRRILAAYACRNPAVGYCQGMNFVAGCLLLFMEEEDAFWCLVAIVEQLLQGYFSMTMVAPQVDQLVLKQLADSHFPRLAKHLEELCVNVASVSTQWFLCLFVNSLPLETCLRVWDIFFFERCASVLFRVALALVDIYAQALVATVDAVDAFSLLQNMAPLSFDSSRLVDVACIAYAHVDHGYLAGLRSGFEATVSAQVQERLARKNKREKRMAEGSGHAEIKCDTEVEPESLPVLPRIQVCSPHSSEPFSCWDPAEAPLHIDSSKAAATAYKIASSPAVDTSPGRRNRVAATGPSNDRAQANHASEFEPIPEEGGPEATLDPDLSEQVEDVLDRRRLGLQQEGALSEDERAATVSQLMALVAKLEEEMFQVEARRFDAENKAASLQREVDLMRQRINETEGSTSGKRAELAALKERRDNEAAAVDAGGQRCLQYANSLRSAEANRALRASLLAEKRELINSLQQELGQVPEPAGRRFLQKLGLSRKRS